MHMFFNSYFEKLFTRLLSWVLSRDFRPNRLITSLAKMFSHTSQHTKVNLKISAYLAVRADLLTHIVSGMNKQAYQNTALITPQVSDRLMKRPAADLLIGPWLEESANGSAVITERLSCNGFIVLPPYYILGLPI